MQQSFNEEKLNNNNMDSERPSLKWDDSFEISISTNDLGLNLTETIFYVSTSKIDSIVLFKYKIANLPNFNKIIRLSMQLKWMKLLQ